MSQEVKRVTLLGSFIWSLAILYFFYEFFLRIFLGTIASDVMKDLHLTMEQFSIVGAAYYITYSLMQVPVGILADRFGARKILTFAAFCCTVGVLGLSMANGFISAITGRLLIGFGSSFAFVSLLILALNWFPRKQFALLAGVAQFLGAIGPMLAGAPLALLNKAVNGNWRLILYGISIFGICLTALIFLFVRHKPKGKKNEMIFLTPHEPIKAKLKELVRIRQVWWILLYSGCIYVSLPLLGAYWGTTYLQTRGFSTSLSAFIISMIWVGFAMGAPIIGKLSDLMKKRRPLLIVTSLFGTLASALILLLPTNNEWLLIALFTMLGFASSGQSLAFPTISEHVPEKLQSPALGLNNSAIMLFGAVIPPIASSIIQSSTTGSNFQLAAFERGLALMPALFFLSMIFAILGIRETYCRQQMAMHKIRVQDHQE